MVDLDMAEDVVMVPVPKQHLGAVYAVLSRAMAGETGTDADAVTVRGDGAEAMTYRGEGQWTRAKIVRLEAEVSHPGTRTLLTMAAERAPRQVGFSEAAQRAHLEDKQLRGELGALTKIVKRIFNGERSWPVSVRYGDQGEACYSMDPEIASWWLEAALSHEA